MRYTEEYAMLVAKTETLESILARKENKEEQIKRYEENDEQDSWYIEQIHNLTLEMKALDALAKIITK